MKISDQTLKLIQRQVSVENSNHLIYEELVDWCEFNSYPEAANFYRHQAAGEIEHRNKFRSFLLDIDVPVTPFTLEKVEYGTISSLEDTVLAGLKVERSTTAEITAILESADENNDHAVFTMIQWFVSEQVEEESLFNNAITWIKNSGLIMAPEWAKATIRSDLSEYLEDLIPE